jgi:hypothetical protein
MKKTILLLSFFAISFYLSAQYTVSTYAGTGYGWYIDSTRLYSQFNQPFGMCLDQYGNIFIADNGNHRIRKIDLNGQVSTYAGSGINGYLDGPSLAARFSSPTDICIDAAGNLYVSDLQSSTIRKIDNLGMVSTIAGSGTPGFLDAPGTAAYFNGPRGICLDNDGNIYVADSWNHRIRKIDVTGNVTTYAGGGTQMGGNSVGSFVDGNAGNARFYTPCGLAIDSVKNIYVADAYNHRLRKIDSLQNVTLLAGRGGSGPGSGASVDGDISTAYLNTPTAVFFRNGKLYFSDTYGNKIRTLLHDTVSTLAGYGLAGLVNGNAATARFNYPRALYVNTAEDSIFVIDCNNHAVRLITRGTIGIEEINNAFNVYPNPSENTFYISDTKNYWNNCSCISLNGKLIHSEMINNINTTEIRLPDASPGLYYCRLCSDSKMVGVRLEVVK